MFRDIYYINLQISFSYLRQIQNPPRVDRILSGHQRDSIKAEMNRLHVNAQVTSMILLLEILFSFIQLALLIIFKAHTFPTLINGIFLWSIVLPHSFLMNTSHNKRRIIEIGWVNVLKNVFKLVARIDGPQVPQNSVRKKDQQLSLPKQTTKQAKKTSVLSSTTDKSFEDICNSKSINVKSLSEQNYVEKSSGDLEAHRKYVKSEKGNIIPLNSSKNTSILVKQDSICRIKDNYTTHNAAMQELRIIDIEDYSDSLFNFKVKNDQK